VAAGVKVFQIVEGTSEIQRLVAVRYLAQKGM
jgi:alkylation response protein AidB-like acyl-CoA dehydrogenase